jgi:hypothetical protein
MKSIYETSLGNKSSWGFHALILSRVVQKASPTSPDTKSKTSMYFVSIPCTTEISPLRAGLWDTKYCLSSSQRKVVMQARLNPEFIQVRSLDTR